MDPITREEFELLKSDIEQHEDQLKEQQKMLSEHTAQLREFREATELLTEAVIQLGIIANVGFAQSTHASGQARNRLIQIGGALEKLLMNRRSAER